MLEGKHYRALHKLLPFSTQFNNQSTEQENVVLMKTLHARNKYPVAHATRNVIYQEWREEVRDGL